ncbi:hypothetical protein RHGRI_012102 [Rhododendron griersonianum]|uniref:Uncharacterized protein n=1 Tax=Rhododendron griersonianum TaxID=479676 RepID=A0AAV6KQP9_9ERIC|nr:hypothetical protein RHGRI_012101 [Rhododendron griersonianum]KAG5554454.1 hypothetical protein RHGRI_012102 [Rhododendron griersonianum]
MVFPRSLFAKLFIVLVLLFASSAILPLAEAARPLNGENWLAMEWKALVIQTLQRGTVPSSGSDGGTYIP